MMKITYFLADNGACGLYRLDNPLLEARKSGRAGICRIDKGDSIMNNLEAFSADIFVLPRLYNKDICSAMQKLQDEGKKLVIDHDDFMFDVHPLNRAYKEFGSEEVKYKMPDNSLIDLWIDRKNINLQENIEKLTGLAKALEQANLITVTTNILADAYRKYNDNVIALPNCIDMSLWQRLPLKRETDEIRLFWSGGDSHYGDWMLISPVLKDIMEKYKKVKLIILGAFFPASVQHLPKDRVVHHPWVSAYAHPYKCAILDPDICIIPLEDTRFNKCKSNIKWVEMSAMEVPCVTSLVSPYKEYAAEDNGIYIEGNSHEAWVEGISYAIENPDKTALFAKKAKETVIANFDIKTQYQRWLTAYNGMENKKQVTLKIA